MPDLTKDPFVYTRYVERAFNRGPRTIQNWVKKGILPTPMKVEGQNAWFLSQIEATREQFAQTARPVAG